MILTVLSACRSAGQGVDDDERGTMTRSAAIFDLDRTLIKSSSATVFGRHLGEAGLSGGGDIPLADTYMRFYEQFGESWLMMQPARLASRAAAGWSVAVVADTMKKAAAELEEYLLPFARMEIDEHRAAGRLLIMATTSPRPFVEPFARRLGFDAVVATEWERDGDTYTGGMDGGFVWGRAKADAVAAFAKANDIALRKSWAYSDSYFDAPLLTAVGHPVAVNPDAKLERHARRHGWPIVHFSQRTKTVVRRTMAGVATVVVAGTSLAAGIEIGSRRRPRGLFSGW